ncbi:MAG: cytochrome c3 family protein [Desulfuromonadales bacterium]|nr:cytochrome c3 family protein [Desulfuromonadales bacterium]
MTIKGLCWVAILLMFFCLLCAPSLGETFGEKKKRAKPHEYGNVLIDNFSPQSEMDPVIFPHWLHRTKYSCRLCHVDLGFVMQAKENKITENDIRKGQYCGACHNGKESFAPESQDASGGTTRNCHRCHFPDNSKLKSDFYRFSKSMPKERFGNGINWLMAEEQGLIAIKDSLPGISNMTATFKGPEDSSLPAGESNIPNIIFSHTKHAVWNGCALCHPDPFGVEKAAQEYGMQEIFDGRFCGECHGKVAFPSLDCRRCHAHGVL